MVGLACLTARGTQTQRFPWTHKYAQPYMTYCYPMKIVQNKPGTCMFVKLYDNRSSTGCKMRNINIHNGREMCVVSIGQRKFYKETPH